MKMLLAAIVLGAVAAIAFSPALASAGPFQAHALRFLLVTYIAVPLGLVLFGMRPRYRAVLGALARPPIAIVAFGVGLALAFVPACVDLALGRPWAGALLAGGWTLTAVVAWWGACAPVGAPGRLREPAAMALLFLLGVPHQIVAGTIATASRALYAGVTLADQKAGAVILWVPGGLLLWVAITALWVRWARREGRNDDDAPPLSIPGGASDPAGLDRPSEASGG